MLETCELTTCMTQSCVCLLTMSECNANASQHVLIPSEIRSHFILKDNLSVLTCSFP